MKTDAQIMEDVIAELKWDPAVSAAGIDVIVKHGVVTLTGHPQSFAEMLAIERATKRVSGVRAIAVEMKVRLATPDAHGDLELATAAEHVLQWNTEVPAGCIDVQVERGWVTLSGSVEWEFQRRAAVHGIADLQGVAGITNNIRIKPRLSPVDIQKGIEGALTRHAEREARHLQVLVNGSHVTLKGTVDSWAESQAAQGAAWSAPGVTAVQNELSLR